MIEEQPKPGRYRHFKGKEYEVLFLGKHSETMEDLVIYRALYGDFGIWVRPLALWNQPVTTLEKPCKRFESIGE